MDTTTQINNISIKLLLYREQFVNPEIFEDLLIAMGKDRSEKSIIVDINSR